MTIIHSTTFRSFHQGVMVTLSLRQDGAKVFVRCQPVGYPVTPRHDTACASLADGEAVYIRKFGVGMTGQP